MMNDVKLTDGEKFTNFIHTPQEYLREYEGHLNFVEEFIRKVYNIKSIKFYSEEFAD